MKGATVGLVVKTQTGTDPFGHPIYTETIEEINDVLIGQPTYEDAPTTLDMTGKVIAYVLGIPKGDTHTWEDTEIIIWGERYRTIGYPVTGIQENIPLRWGKNVKVERYG